MKNGSFLMKDIIKNSTNLLKHRDYVSLILFLPQMFIVLFIFESVSIKMVSELRLNHHEPFAIIIGHMISSLLYTTTATLAVYIYF